MAKQSLPPYQFLTMIFLELTLAIMTLAPTVMSFTTILPLKRINPSLPLKSKVLDITFPQQPLVEAPTVSMAVTDLASPLSSSTMFSTFLPCARISSVAPNSILLAFPLFSGMVSLYYPFVEKTSLAALFITTCTVSTCLSFAPANSDLFSPILTLHPSFHVSLLGMSPVPYMVTGRKPYSEI